MTTQSNDLGYDWKDSVVLVTGGTGSFGKAFAKFVLEQLQPRRLIIFSRDELKQHDMRVGGLDHPNIRYFIGDVRDADRLRRALNGVDFVVHAAALKQVPACEYNPIEAVLTNVMGSRNVIDAAIDLKVKKVVFISTDKAVNPVNLYGATKLVAEKLTVQANAYAGAGPTRFSCVRYGNVIGSRGSVIPLFMEQKKSGKITVTDPRMTRFWITLTQGVRLVIRAIEEMRGGEIFVPKLPATTIMDLVKVIAPECNVESIGFRPGEKLHEVLMSDEEARRAVEVEGMYVIKPATAIRLPNWRSGKPLPEDFYYGSDRGEFLAPDAIRALVGNLGVAE
jgi:UDP-N-acetylglucosamine 4,6-dehydratase